MLQMSLTSQLGIHVLWTSYYFLFCNGDSECGEFIKSSLVSWEFSVEGLIFCEYCIYDV